MHLGDHNAHNHVMYVLISEWVLEFRTFINNRTIAISTDTNIGMDTVCTTKAISVTTQISQLCTHGRSEPMERLVVH